jgi:hypothetical protein
VPTASEYDAFADTFDGHAEQLARSADLATRHRLVEAAGSTAISARVAAAVASLVDHCRNAARPGAPSSRPSAGAAPRRAGATPRAWGSYQRAVVEWERAAADTGHGPRPAPPVRPHSWVERG